MDLTAWLLRWTPVRLLLVTTPGGASARLAVERWAREHGWHTAHSPAEANLMVIAGPACTELSPHIDLAWSSMPAPRAQAYVASADDVPHTLTTALPALRDIDLQRGEARHLARTNTPAEASCGSGMPEHEHGGHDMAGMKMPGDIPMADRADDRDGLKLDRLHVPLGPVLTDWPPGLVVHTVLQGDVIQHAQIELFGEHGENPLPPLVQRLDNSARLLSVAGWPDVAARARLLRDLALDGTSPPGLDRWASRVRRSRTLRWLLSGVGTTESGDALARLHSWLGEDDLEAVSPEVLPALLEGTELATARLVVASLDLRMTVRTHG